MELLKECAGNSITGSLEPNPSGTDLLNVCGVGDSSERRATLNELVLVSAEMGKVDPVTVRYCIGPGALKDRRVR